MSIIGDTFGNRPAAYAEKRMTPYEALSHMYVRLQNQIDEDNVDEDSSAGQMQWYYRQTRAN